MYLVALCDDEKEELNKTEKILKDYEKRHPGLDFVIKKFEYAGELLCEVTDESYMPDLILMDIYMPDKAGMETAKELRDAGYRGKLVFLTASREHALEAFDVAAAQYLVKPVPEDKIFSMLDQFLRDTESERRKYILLRIERRLVKVSVDDIVYCEAQGKIQYLYLADGTKHLLHMTMTDIYGLLSQHQEFIRVGAAFIINLEYVSSLNAKEIYMDNGKSIYLPRGTYKPLREQYFNYYCKEMG